MSARSSSKLRIVRRGGYADMLRSYKIFVNDEATGSIARNSVLDLDVPSGPLKVEARVDWGRSQPVMIEAQPDQTVEVEVSNHWGPWLAPWAITFGASSYLTLKQTPPPA
jgi:hypothetical protein